VLSSITENPRFFAGEFGLLLNIKISELSRISIDFEFDLWILINFQCSIGLVIVNCCLVSLMVDSIEFVWICNLIPVDSDKFSLSRRIDCCQLLPFFYDD